MIERSAWDVPGGRLVQAELGGETTLCLKAQRRGKDFINHYLVPLAPLPAGRQGMALVYIDPDTPLVEAGGVAMSVETTDAAAADIGQVIANAAGQFLKVADTARTERCFAYVDLASGDIRLRQERLIQGIMAWRIAEST